MDKNWTEIGHKMNEIAHKLDTKVGEFGHK